MKSFVFSFLLFFALFLSLSEDSFACSCVVDKTGSLNQQVRDAYKNSAAVFAGKVVGIDKVSHPTLITVTIQVSDSWKGNVPPTIQIVTNKGSDACEFPFVLNADYLVYAISENNNLSTNVCLRTNLLQNNPDIAILNKITKRAP